ncbi:hypothetical protein AB0J80_36230 [Actinoplanes sp. NPDC049548]|uniref:hypothetical protein n=1 Tax=Actinoplanes sp. NPDC049548 TaxID=3155152 RepID=UPI003412B63D
MHYPRAYAWWERLAWWRLRRCAACGVQWPCDEAKKERLRKRLNSVRFDRIGAWAPVVSVHQWQTQAYEQVGRVGNMTPAQLNRSRGNAA